MPSRSCCGISDQKKSKNQPKQHPKETNTSLVIALIKLWADIDPTLFTTYPSLLSDLTQRPTTPPNRNASASDVSHSPVAGRFAHWFIAMRNAINTSMLGSVIRPWCITRRDAVNTSALGSVIRSWCIPTQHASSSNPIALPGKSFFASSCPSSSLISLFRLPIKLVSLTLVYFFSSFQATFTTDDQVKLRE